MKASRPEELPDGIRGCNRLKDRGFQSNFSVLILPCGACRKEGENKAGNVRKKAEYTGLRGYVGNLPIAICLYF
jgi:hypothetical protein